MQSIRSLSVRKVNKPVLVFVPSSRLPLRPPFLPRSPSMSTTAAALESTPFNIPDSVLLISVYLPLPPNLFICIVPSMVNSTSSPRSGYHSAPAQSGPRRTSAAFLVAPYACPPAPRMSPTLRQRRGKRPLSQQPSQSWTAQLVSC
jgi:hypothetical protein